jgi:hypothetical protein
MRILVFDLETDRILSNARDNHRELQVTVGQFCSFDWDLAELGPSPCRAWTEYVAGSAAAERGGVLGEGVPPLFEAADRIVAYNGRAFDMRVLRGAAAHCGVTGADIDRWEKKLRDPFEAIRDATGSWVKLGELLDVNAVPFRKSGDGISAVEWWANGETRRVADYCRGDVEGLVALISMPKITFPIKTWRMDACAGSTKTGTGAVEGGYPARAKRASVQVVTGWAELDWKAVLGAP